MDERVDSLNCLQCVLGYGQRIGSPGVRVRSTHDKGKDFEAELNSVVAEMLQPVVGCPSHRDEIAYLT